MKLMRWIVLISLLFVSAAALAFGGAQKLAYLSGYSFRDIIGHTYSDKYGWNGHQNVGASRMVFMGTTSPSRFNNSTVAWQIQTGDDPLSNGTNRNELIGMFGAARTDESPASGTQYYAMSVYIPTGWVDPAGTTNWFIIFQMHGDDTNVGHSAQPCFSFSLAGSASGLTNHYFIRTVGGAIGTLGAIDSANDVITDLGAHVYN